MLFEQSGKIIQGEFHLPLAEFDACTCIFAETTQARGRYWFKSVGCSVVESW